MPFRIARLTRAGLVVITCIASAAGLTSTGAALAAAKPATTRVVAHVTPSTVKIGARFVVSGTATPKGGSVVVEHLVGNVWTSYGHTRVSAKGTWTLSITAPTKAAVMAVRVIRGASTAATAGVSPTLHVRATTAAYVVSAHATSTNAGNSLAITGAVRPKATGSVQLQLLTRTTWVAAGSAKLSAASTFSFSTVKPAGHYRFRVVKVFSKLVAGGISATATGTVSPASPPITTPPTSPPATTPPTTPPVTTPVLSTTSLPQAVTTKPYSGQLAVTGGTAPYVWSLTPTSWLHVGPTGILSGTPTTPGTLAVSATVTDSKGQLATAALSVTVVHVSGMAKAWGDNSDGQLGDGTQDFTSAPTAMHGPGAAPTFTDAIAFAAGGLMGYTLRVDGTVWAAGDNSVGELGNGGTASTSSTPVQVTGLTGVTAIAASFYAGIALKPDGTVWTWGDNADGELGTGAAVNQSDVPVEIDVPTGMKAIKAIAAGESDVYALDTAGVVWSWGTNMHGELGNGTTFFSGTPTKVNGFANMVGIAAGVSDGYEVSATGTVYGWGSNDFYQLHYGDTNRSLNPQLISGVTGVTQLAAGADMAYGLRTDGTAVAWGEASVGELGDGSSSDPTTPVAVDLPANLTFTQIAAAGSTGYAVDAAGDVYSWGDYAGGALGTGATTSALLPAKITTLAHVIALGSGSTSRTGYAAVDPSP